MKILFLDIDTLRPDHLGCYGYHRNTSPNIDRIADRGVRFENYYCSDAPCLPSRTALMTGQFGIHTGVVGHGGTCADIRPEGASRGFEANLMRQSLPGFLRWSEALRGQSYRTATISPFAERHGAWQFYAGFSDMHNTGKCGMESAHEVTGTALEWIRSHGQEENWFLHINYWDPHGPFRAPEQYEQQFAGDPLPEWYTEEVLAQHQKLVGPKKPNEIYMFNDDPNNYKANHPLCPDQIRYPGRLRDMNDVRTMFDGYDGGVRYADEHVGMILDALKEQNIADDLAIIITSDHGENLGEMGIWSEHGTSDYITHRIPLIIAWPGGKQGHVDRGLHYNLDIAPTLAGLLGAAPAQCWDGSSFASAITKGQDSGRDHLVLSQCTHVCQRSVRWDQWHYIRTYHDGYHLFPDEMLFDVEQDPHEENNLAEARPDLCKEAVYRLNQWHDQMMKTMPNYNEADPLWTVIRENGPFHARGQLAGYCEFLKKTGRGWAVEELRKRHPREFKTT